MNLIYDFNKQTFATSTLLVSNSRIHHSSIIKMSSSTISAMMMMVGDMSSLSSLPSFNTNHIDDIGMDDDTFQKSEFDLYIPETYDKELWDNYDYLNANTHRFFDCVSRDYLIQGESLRLFLIARVPQYQSPSTSLASSQSSNTNNNNNNNISISSSTTTMSAPTNTTTTNNNGGMDNLSKSGGVFNNNITVVPPMRSASQNLSFEIQLRYSTETSKATYKDFHNAVNVTEFNPKHTHVSTDMRNNYLPSAKSSTSYLRSTTANGSGSGNATNNANNNNNGNNNNGNTSPTLIDKSKRFIGEVIDISSPFETNIPNRDSINQKPNYFKLSNGDIIFPIEIPIYIKEIYEDKQITFVIKVNRSKNYRVLLTNENKLDRLLQTDTLAFPKSIAFRSFWKNFTLVQPLRLNLKPNIVTLGTKNLITVVVENNHPSITLTIRDINTYLFHVLNMELSVTVDPVSGQSIPTHRQKGHIIKANEHYILTNLTKCTLPILLEPYNKHSFVLSVEPSALQKSLPPLDGFYTKIKLSWDLPISSGQILSLFDLKISPPPVSELMVSIDSPSPVLLYQKFKVIFKISNLSTKSKQITINIPSCCNQKYTSTAQKVIPNGAGGGGGGTAAGASTSHLKLSSLIGNKRLQSQQQSSNSLINQSSTTTTSTSTTASSSLSTTTSTLSESTTSSGALKSSGALPKSSTGKLLPSTSSPIGSPVVMSSGGKYVPAEPHIQFSEMTQRTLTAFDDVQDNSVNIVCLQKSIYVGDIDAKSSVSISVDFIALKSGLFEISDITLFDVIEKKTFSLKESLQICCIDPSHQISDTHHQTNPF
ncbi:hypothetical protein DFA_07570 [Cavenderia fasciculata]|uniref:Trafficking protein particle complex subunit 13 C-terminal domain-containing protein n=1 Tax=Cavenderia fasciculata TaxID=261658 RepID=F4PWT2_CACFS|nr:uncharacterized protein DFA_07570 [Cavenderia fasciculata]EGG20446.1 hypothetical protein DFA_07570 [Cavenderia fasciculata]|eukprot:XP_004367429.1 hypothetical protein DFA_07570 [Cavenderia fasciculata]